MARQHTPSQMRGIVKNPNNPAYHADVANRTRLGHANVPPPSPVPAAQPAPTNQSEPKK